MQSYKSYYIHGVTTNSLHLSFSPCKATNLTTWCHHKQSSLILFTMQSYKSYYMVSPQTVFTYPFHHAKLQILLHGVTTNSLYLSFSPCKATNLTTWCHHKQSLLILFTMQSYKSYYMVSPQTVLTYPFHHAKLQILHGFTTNSLYLSFSPCKASSVIAILLSYQIMLIEYIDPYNLTNTSGGIFETKSYSTWNIRFVSWHLSYNNFQTKSNNIC